MKILITGASTGIGAETARELAEGNEIFIHYNSSAPIAPADVAIDTVRAPMQSTGWLRAIRSFVSGSFPAFGELCRVHFCYQLRRSAFAERFIRNWRGIIAHSSGFYF